MKAAVLLSGGLDSMACIKYYKDLNYDIDSVFFDYGQPSLKEEAISAKKVADYFDIPFTSYKITTPNLTDSGEFIARNTLLVFSAFAILGYGTYKIIIGVHDGTNYTDCSKLFLDKLNDLLVLHSNGKIICEAPFVNYYKSDIIHYIKKMDLPMELTYSCEIGDGPCGKCLSCLDRMRWQT